MSDFFGVVFFSASSTKMLHKLCAFTNYESNSERGDQSFISGDNLDLPKCLRIKTFINVDELRKIFLHTASGSS